MKRKLSWHFYAVVSVVAVIAVAVTLLVMKRVEFSYEMADLQAMHVAHSLAEIKWKDKLPEEPVEYWYDGVSFALVPASDAKPEPCGTGTRRAGGAAKSFQAETDIRLDAYNESESYLGKLPRVRVWQENHALSISIDWVE